MSVVLKCPHTARNGKKCNNTLGIIRDGMLVIKNRRRIVANIPFDKDITFECEKCKNKTKLKEMVATK